MISADDPILKYQPLWGYWNVEDIIGQGSFGKVYRVSREMFGEKYVSAVKIISIPSEHQYREALLDTGDDEESLKDYFEDMVKAIVSEITLLYGLRGHSNIVSYEDHMIEKKSGQIGWDILIRMEYVSSLMAYLSSKQASRKEIIRLGIDICSALETCEKKGIIHRDIKDENIFVSQNGSFKLGDFGIAREISESGKAASMKGTPLYMAPEIMRGELYGANVDLYSLGLVLYRLLNQGRMPFVPDYPQKIKRQDTEKALDMRLSGQLLPRPNKAGQKLAGVVLKACSFNPKDRYSSATEMKQDLENLLSSLRKDELEEIVTVQAAKVSIDGSGVTMSKKIDETVVIVNETAYAPEETVVLMSSEQSLSKGQAYCQDTVVLGTGQETPPGKSMEKDSQAGSNQSKKEEKNQEVRTPLQKPDSIEKVSLNNSRKTAGKKSPGKLVAIGAAALILIASGVFGVKYYMSGQQDNGTAQNGTAAAVSSTQSPATSDSKKEGQIGNTAGNIINDGRAVLKSDGIYYSSSTGTYRMDPKGENNTKIYDRFISNINIVSGWIYFGKFEISKMKTDGTELVKISDDWSSYLSVQGNWIYYCNEKEKNSIYKIKDDGTGRTKICEDNAAYLNVVGDYIYYSNTSDSGKLYKVKSDGSGKTKISDDYSIYINAVDGWIYYVGSFQRLYKIKPDGTGKTKINDNRISDLNISGGWAYFVESADKCIYKIKTDGTGRTKLNSDDSSIVNVAGDWIFYHKYENGNYITYKMKTDGSQRQKA